MSTVIPDIKGVNIFLVGMMGAGKSTTGRMLAEMLGYQFFDSDAVIEQSVGQSINDMFAHAGEAEFRTLEARVLSELSSYRRLVIATGGGAVLSPMNWSYMRHGLVVWLNVELDTLWERLKHDDSRPLLKSSNPFATLKDKLEQRLSLYQQADITVDVPGHFDPSQICAQTFDLINIRLRDRDPAQS